MKRWHPDRHGGAPWAVAKARRVLAAATALKEGTAYGAAGAAPRPASGRRRWWTGQEVRFYPLQVDYWADWGATPPTPEEAAAFEARYAEAQQSLRARRAAEEAAAAAAAARYAADAAPAERFAVALAAAALAVLMAHTGESSANHGAPRGAAATGDCAARGGGWCRFL
jgi:hypothetical protein